MIIVLASQFHVYLPWVKARLALVGAFSVIVQLHRWIVSQHYSPPIQLLPRGLAGQHLNKWLSLFQLDQLCTFYVYYFIYSQSGQKCPEKLRRMRWKLKRKHTCHDNWSDWMTFKHFHFCDPGHYLLDTSAAPLHAGMFCSGSPLWCWVLLIRRRSGRIRARCNRKCCNVQWSRIQCNAEHSYIATRPSRSFPENHSISISYFC